MSSSIDFSKVTRVAIYPSIGIARVGNSPNEYFLGPQIPGQHPNDPDCFRDTEGRIKRQGSQFFIYGLDEKGNVLCEINDSHGAKVDWTVEVANRKSGWYNFDLALDIPAAKGKYDSNGNATPDGEPLLSPRRNQEYQGDKRHELMITPASQKITGRNINQDGAEYKFDDGKIAGKNVYLGELRTDDLGRLIFLGGLGKSDSFNGKPLVTFANNQGWHDDTSDGSVDACVTLPDGRTLDAEGAWVLTAPPNFAVGVQAFTTGFDLLRDVAASKHPSHFSDTPLFYQDIYPILKNLSLNQWVNAGVAREFGWGTGNDFDQAQLLEKLSIQSNSSMPFRQAVFQSFRNPDYEKLEPLSWPPLYGDAVTFNMNSTDPRNWYAVTKLQYAHLVKWAKGEFELDAKPTELAWETMSPEQQANGLTQSALEETLGGPFHPGCEFTWPMRHAKMYSDAHPFRIKHSRNKQEDYGIAINSETALKEGGPLDGSSPGDITKWMAVPWQSDTSSCLSAYRAYAGEYLPTFWPARVPNDVLTQKDFDTIESSESSTEEKITAFSPDRRKKWLRGYIYNDEGKIRGGSSVTDRESGIKKFTEHWDKIGIILKKPLKADPELFPSEVWVETGRQLEDKSALGAAETLEEFSDNPKWTQVNPRKLR